MEQNRHQPNPPQQPTEQDYAEVILEPIQDLGLSGRPKQPKKGGSLAGKRKKRRRQQRVIIILGAVFVVVLSLFVFMFIRNQRQAAADAAAQIAAEEAARAQKEKEDQEYYAMVNSTTFLQGITINGIDIGGMTMDEAKTALSSAQSNLTAQRELQLVYDNKLYPLDLTGIPSTVNTDAVLKEAYSLGKSGGDYTSLKAEAYDVSANGRAYTIAVSYDPAALTAAIAQIAAQIDLPAQDAKVTGIDEDTHALTIKDETVGRAVDQTALTAQISDTLQTGSKTPINIPVVATQPTLTKAMLTGLYVKRGEKTTDFSSSDSGRKHNIRKGAALINGTVLLPGEVFSANDTLGTRSKENGWEIAHAYVQGAIEEQYGGGVCQLSTTLYNAVVMSDLEIVFRRNHSMPVTYVDKGLDATINSVGNLIDFQFKNNTKGDIVIIGYTTKANKLVFEVWGFPFDTTEYDQIKLTSVQVSMTAITGDPVRIEKPVGTEKPDGSLMVAGEELIAVAPRDGYVYQSYKNFYKAGSLVKKEKLAVSTYKSYQGEIWFCLPDESVTPTPTPTPEITPEYWVTDTPVPTAVPATSP